MAKGTRKERNSGGIERDKAEIQTAGVWSVLMRQLIIMIMPPMMMMTMATMTDENEMESEEGQRAHLNVKARLMTALSSLLAWGLADLFIHDHSIPTLEQVLALVLSWYRFHSASVDWYIGAAGSVAHTYTAYVDLILSFIW